MEVETSRYLPLPAGTKYVPFGRLPRMIANALHGTDDLDEERQMESGFNIATAAARLDAELVDAARAGRLKVIDPLTFGRHNFAKGLSLSDALVKVTDLHEYLSERDIQVRLLVSVGTALTAEISSDAATPTGAVTPAEPPPASEPVPGVVVAAPRTKVSQAAAKEALPDDPMQRRRTCLDWFRAEDGKRPKEAGKRGKRGALQRVVEKSGIDKDTLGAMLDKAVDEKRNADVFAQLTAKR